MVVSTNMVPAPKSLPSVKAEVADEDIGDDRIGDIMQDLGPAEEGTKLNNVCVGVFAVMCVCVCVCPCIAPPPPCLLLLLLCIALHRTPFVPLCLLQVRK